MNQCIGMIGETVEASAATLPRTADNAPYVKLYVTRPQPRYVIGRNTPPQRAQPRYLMVGFRHWAVVSGQ